MSNKRDVIVHLVTVLFSALPTTVHFWKPLSKFHSPHTCRSVNMKFRAFKIVILTCTATTESNKIMYLVHITQLILCKNYPGGPHWFIIVAWGLTKMFNGQTDACSLIFLSRRDMNTLSTFHIVGWGILNSVYSGIFYNSPLECIFRIGNS